MPQVQRTLLWQRVDRPGTEYFGLWQDETGWQLRGTVILALDGPLKVRYGVLVDEQWKTRAVHIGLRGAGPEAILHVTTKDGRWFQGNEELEGLRGCIDVDLEITPATNTLPIRRLALTMGESSDLQVAWIRFPGLAIERSAQRYTRLEGRRYRYESGTFGSELEVDDLGLVVDYAAWIRAPAIGPDSDDDLG